MNLNELKREIKRIILDTTAKLVGIGNRELLRETPPSANKDYCLPGAQSCKLNKNGEEVIYYSPSEEEFFTKEEFDEIDEIKKIE